MENLNKNQNTVETEKPESSPLTNEVLKAPQTLTKSAHNLSSDKSSSGGPLIIQPKTNTVSSLKAPLKPFTKKPDSKSKPEV